MKGDSNLKQATVLLMAYVLVVGFVGASGMVDGATTADNTVTAEVTDDTIEINNVTYTDSTSTDQEIIANTGEGTNFGYSESSPATTTGSDITFSGNITVYSNESLENIDHAEINIYSDNQTMGDALGLSGDSTHFYQNFTNPDDGTWDGESETLSFEFTTVDSDTFLRYGSWNIDAEMSNETDGQLDSVSFNNALFAEEHTVFSVPVDLSASISPGQSVGINTDTTTDVTFTETNGNTVSAQVDVTSNYNWSLSLSTATLTSSDSPDEITADTATHGTGSGNPTSETLSNLELLYTATNVRPGTYDVTLTHTLTNTDA